MGEGTVLSLYDTKTLWKKPTYFLLRMIEIVAREKMIRQLDCELNFKQREEECVNQVWAESRVSWPETVGENGLHILD